ncbi:6-phosphogluconate dehydrogenase C-terminal domain-like protein, partial [Cadophora sp. DSE1049]
EGVGHKNMRAHLDPQVQADPQQEPVNRTIHILGLGAVGKYIAHSLAGLPFPPPVTLLMHRPLMMQQWHDEGAAIHVIKGGEIKTHTNFHIESSADFVREDSRQRFPGFGPNLEHTSEPPNYQIDALIVTTEAFRTVSALTAIRHRLGRSSTIFILNNGLGLAERINEKVFPDYRTRPTYILGNMSHNLESTERHFTLIEKNSGRLECSKFPQVSITRRGNHAPTFTRKDFSWTAPASHLIGTLARTPEFSTVTLGHKSFYESQFQNLAAGAVIGPLSVVFDCTNDLLLYNFSASQAMKLLLREISRVIRSLPELQSLSDLDETFGVKRLEAIVVSRISKSGKNLSAMLQSIRAGNRTDIDYYNGYIERRARELGIDTPRNQMMLHLVRGKSAAKSRELNNYIPFEENC